MTALHQSTAKVAQHCLARYRAECVEGKRGVMTAAEVGTAVHAAIEFAYVATATGSRDPLDAALEGLGTWAQAQAPRPTARVLAEAETLLRGAYAPDSSLYLRLPPPPQKVVVEQAWAMDADFNAVPLDSPDVAYAGIIDVCEWGPKGVRLRDHKTIRRMVSNDDLAEDIQGWLYALWALSAFGVDEVEWRYTMIRHDYEPHVTFARGEAWEGRAKRLFRAIRSQIAWAEDLDEWPETPGAGCQYCPVRHKCEALATLIEQGSVSADTSAEGAARIYLAAKSVASQAESMARAAAKDAPIPVGTGRVLGFKPGVRKVLHPLIRCLAQFTADGVKDAEIAECFPGASVTKAGLDKLALMLAVRGVIEDPLEWAEAFRVEQPSATFKVHNEGAS